jgi:light-regulated signal transduction histidine kinase (bacteriophytochrome)
MGRFRIDAASGSISGTRRIRGGSKSGPARQEGRSRRSPRSCGLGLAIARKLALAHGGDIGIESALGKGTEVTVSLPR